jgi:hypothetical protein
MPYTIGISITLFVIAGLFCRFANSKTVPLKAKSEVLRISMADLPLNLEDTRKELWSSGKMKQKFFWLKKEYYKK